MIIAIGYIFCLLAGVLLTALKIPLGMMFGSLITVIILKYWRITIPALPGSITLIQLSLGTSIGSMFHDVSFIEYDGLFLLINLLCLCLLLQFTISYLWCVRRLRWSREEAILGAVPGAMAAVLALAIHTDTPPQKIVISHALRLIVLTVLAGFIAGEASGPNPSLNLFEFNSLENILWIVSIAFTGFISGKLLEKMHIPAPFIVTSLLCSVSLNAIAPQSIHFPEVINQLSMILMGILIGHHFITFPLSQLMKNLWASIQLIILSLGTTFAMAFSAAELFNYPLYLLILSWVPGSIESMSFAALALKADAGFIIVNHLIRMLLIHTIPALVLRYQKREV